MTRRDAIQLPALLQVRTTPTGTDRDYWLSVAQRVAEPVLVALSAGRLRADMPVESAPV
jgi:hypothetical protein